MPATKPLKVPLVEIRDGVDQNPRVEQVDSGSGPATALSRRLVQPTATGSFTRGNRPVTRSPPLTVAIIFA